MEVLSWLWWLLKIPLGLVWFLIGGWISTLLQIAVAALAIFTWKHGWRRAPLELWAAAQTVTGWLWAWLRGGKGGAAEPRVITRIQIKEVRVRDRHPGDINISTLMSLMTMAGLAALTLLS